MERSLSFVATVLTNIMVGSATGEKDINFSSSYVEIDQGSYLSAAEKDIGSTFVWSHNECVLHCTRKSSCKSFNLATVKNDDNGMVLCEILSTSKYENSTKLQPSKRFHHYTVVGRCVNQKAGYGLFALGREPSSCAEILKQGYKTSGVYTINPDGQCAFSVYCDMETDGGGWTVLQRRQDGSVEFYRGWDNYKNGFGSLEGEFWLGNDNIHRLTASVAVEVRFDLEDFEGNKRFATYKNFNVLDEKNKYKVSIGSYRGTAGDSFAKHNGMAFTTMDRDNDMFPSNCAVVYKGAWWYMSCHSVNINGRYEGGETSFTATGVNWQHFKGYNYSLKKTEMKIRPE